MLISKVPDDDRGKGESRESPVGDNSHEYQTANELFEIMGKNPKCNTSDRDKLTARDLVLLYKNIDVGPKLVSSTKELQRSKPNQHVENIIYNDSGSDSSDVSDVYSNEDLRNVILINKERIDLLTNQASVENTLCHKLGDLEIRTSVNEYDKRFLFQDGYIKEQLKRFNFLSNNTEVEGTVLPASLMDYVCCKRLEDNYTFYMDSIIRYVKNTIEQLKRISNGDYLTDKAKEKWREVEHVKDPSHSNTKILATSTSIPLHVERKVSGRKSTWDDIVHSAVDVRSLSKILEKKIVVEIPKLIKGSYTLLSKCCADNLIISCKKDQPVEDSNESRVDVVFQLKRSERGHVISNISSIMILQSASLVQDNKPADAPLPLMYKENNNIDNGREKSVKITEINSSTNEEQELEESSELDADNSNGEEIYSDSFDYFSSQDNRHSVSLRTSNLEEMSQGSDILSSNNNLDESQTTDTLREALREASFDVCPDELCMTIQRLPIQTALPEENAEDASQPAGMKKKSPTRVRIKSPYENQSFVMEEKKRKKLLEIRERRERKKMALAESCKITKHKYGKGAVMPHASSSVTKLSITNKSFYNSIYGQSTNVDPNQAKNKNRKGGIKRESLDVTLENLESDQEATVSPERNTKKFINRSYYLDDTVTEMMYIKQQEKETDICSASTSGASNNIRNILSQLMAPCDSEINIKEDETDEKVCDESPKHTLIVPDDSGDNQEIRIKQLAASQSALNIVPSNTPKGIKTEHDKKATTSVECRKSIDKIYQLMNQLGRQQSLDNKSQNKFPTNASNKTDGKGSSSIQGSDSGTSLKHHLTSSNPSTFSFDKNNNNEDSNKKSRSAVNVVPKVIISSKSHIPSPKTDGDKYKDRRNVGSPINVQENNPLKAISQLLHEFENVQRNRQKSGTEQKPVIKKTEPVTITSNDGKTSSRQGSYKRRSRLERHNDAMDRCTRATTIKDKKARPATTMDVPKIPYQQVPTDDRFADKNGKKKITDILDEAKEARGEAVRGPSKFNSRLNSLAQPKRSYVQAHSEEYQNRYGRNLITDRLQRLAATPPSPQPADRTAARFPMPRNKMKRNVEGVSPVSLKLPFHSRLPIERDPRLRHSSSSSPERKEKINCEIVSSYKQINVPETPETLKKKMVAVESYVKNHYGRASFSSPLYESQTPHKSRAPLLPDDLDMSSSSSSPPQESAQVGSKLHRIIDSMIKNTSHGLEVLAECQESNSRTSKENPFEFSASENMSRRDEGVSIDSDCTTNTGDEPLALPINYIDNNNISKEEHQQTNPEDTNCNNLDIQPFKSVTFLENVEYASYRSLSMGTFSKRLGTENVTLTPEPSIQQLFLYQSGDAGSLMVKASLSQNFQTEKLLDLKAMPMLSKSHWDLSFTNIPMQITTVGYAFPEYDFTRSYRSASPSLNRLLQEVSKNSPKSSIMNTMGKSSTASKVSGDTSRKDKCSKSMQFQPLLEQDTHADAPTSSTQPNTGLSCSCNVSKNKTPEASTIGSSGTEISQEECQTIHRTETRILKEKNGNAEGVGYTTSLDVLVGLLNEIQKITTCQTHITNNESEECKELEMILNKTSIIEQTIQNNRNSISITSLDKLRCLESNPSLYSFYLSDSEGQEIREKIEIKPDLHTWYERQIHKTYPKPICADKGVSADITDKECVSRLTDVSSILFPIMINHSTNVTSSLLGEICQSSSQSLFSLTDYHSTNSNPPSSKSNYSDSSSKKMIEVIKIVDEPQVTCKSQTKEVAKVNEPKPLEQKSPTCEKEANKQKTVKKPKNQYCLKTTDFDPVMKMKRDILVTIYSMLVFTVFAALSFPEVLYHV